MNVTVQKNISEQDKMECIEIAESLQKLPLDVKERIKYMIQGAELVSEPPEIKAS